MHMDYNQLQALLDKYWSCETSLEEEQQLRDYFASGEVPESLANTAALFRFYHHERMQTTTARVTERIKEHINQANQRPASKMISLRSLRIAAGLLVVVAATWLVRQEVRRGYPAEVVDTYSDPKLAFEETKKALQMISRGFGKAKTEAGRMKMFHEAEQKIQGTLNDSSDEKEIENI